MPEIPQSCSGLSGSYWIAFLLTGSQDLSAELVIEAYLRHEDSDICEDAISNAKLRRMVVTRALAARSEELARSAKRSISQGGDRQILPTERWLPIDRVSFEQLQNALLAIDIFPRCALLLTMFEGFTLHEAAVLLNSDSESLLDARITGLLDMTHTLTGRQNCAPEQAMTNCSSEFFQSL